MRILLFLALVSALSCSDELDLSYDVNVGSFELLDESIQMLPYLDKEQVVFQDSLGNELVLDISQYGPFSYPSAFSETDVYRQGDTVTYHYDTETISLTAENDSLDIQFTTGLTASLHFDEPQAGLIADILHISMNQQGPPVSFTSVFVHVINQRTWPEDLDFTVNLGTLIIFNKEFADVLWNDNPFFESNVFFNYDVGIVSFLDHSGKKWRFERFQ